MQAVTFLPQSQLFPTRYLTINSTLSWLLFTPVSPLPTLQLPPAQRGLLLTYHSQLTIFTSMFRSETTAVEAVEEVEVLEVVVPARQFLFMLNQFSK